MVQPPDGSMTGNGFRQRLRIGTVVDVEEVAPKNNCPQALADNRDIPAANRCIFGSWGVPRRTLSCAAYRWHSA